MKRGTIPPAKRCEWCGQEDFSTGKDPDDPNSCFSCQYARVSIPYFLGTKKGREWLMTKLKEAEDGQVQADTH
jgi:hypothetical protein